MESPPSSSTWSEAFILSDDSGLLLTNESATSSSMSFESRNGRKLLIPFEASSPLNPFHNQNDYRFSGQRLRGEVPFTRRFHRRHLAHHVRRALQHAEERPQLAREQPQNVPHRTTARIPGQTNRVPPLRLLLARIKRHNPEKSAHRVPRVRTETFPPNASILPPAAPSTRAPLLVARLHPLQPLPHGPAQLSQLARLVAPLQLA